MRQFQFLVLLLALLPGCSRSDPDAQTADADARWYTTAQVAAGEAVFQQHCAQCHGGQAQGLVDDWRKTQTDGAFPPPPLNGTAHAWHHPLSVLQQVINEGGAPFGGKMPAFAGVLEDEEKVAAVAFFQNLWTDEIYAQWLQMGGTD